MTRIERTHTCFYMKVESHMYAGVQVRLALFYGIIRHLATQNVIRLGLQRGFIYPPIHLCIKSCGCEAMKYKRTVPSARYILFIGLKMTGVFLKPVLYLVLVGRIFCDSDCFDM